MITSARFADRMKATIPGAQLTVFEGCAHAPIYEKVEEFNRETLAFLRHHSS
jgi:pimeloyl-ACP methyl ester carboxylesterase